MVPNTPTTIPSRVPADAGASASVNNTIPAFQVGKPKSQLVIPSDSGFCTLSQYMRGHQLYKLQ